MEYLEYFREARGGIYLPGRRRGALDDRTCRQGIGIQSCLLLRANSSPFPSSFKETLVEFPRDLRAADTVFGEDKVLHEQEERRLFYVAMTRARDSLTIYAKEGTGKKDRLQRSAS